MSSHSCALGITQVNKHQVNYDSILNQELMKLLKLNTDIAKEVITWEKKDKLSVLVVPHDLWTAAYY